MAGHLLDRAGKELLLLALAVMELMPFRTPLSLLIAMLGKCHVISVCLVPGSIIFLPAGLAVRSTGAFYCDPYVCPYVCPYVPFISSLVWLSLLMDIWTSWIFGLHAYWDIMANRTS